MAKATRERRARRARRRQRTAGFTLTELMMVVAVIAISAALAGPAMYQALAESRTNQASHELVRVIKRARSEAGAYGRAHLLNWTSGSGGKFEVFRGTSSACNFNDWGDGTTGGGGSSGILTEGACGTAGSHCVDELDLTEPDNRYTLGDLNIEASEVGSATFLQICYEPSGRVLHRTATTAAFTDTNTVNGGWVFRFQRMDGATPMGVARRVVVPLGGDARLLQ